MHVPRKQQDDDQNDYTDNIGRWVGEVFPSAQVDASLITGCFHFVVPIDDTEFNVVQVSAAK